MDRLREFEFVVCLQQEEGRRRIEEEKEGRSSLVCGVSRGSIELDLFFSLVNFSNFIFEYNIKGEKNNNNVLCLEC